MSDIKNLLVLGATGKQGSGVIKAIIASPERDRFHIYAVTRDPTSPSAQRLAALGPTITTVKGDFTLSNELFEAVGVPIWGVLLYGVWTGGGQTPAKEEAQGKAMIDASISHGVTRLVYNSVERGGDVKSATNPTPVTHWASKCAVERYLIEKAASTANNGTFSYTILRPVSFFENFSNDTTGRVTWRLYQKLDRDKPADFISTADIGWFAAQSFINPEDETYKNKAMGLSGDQLTLKELNDTFKKVTGKDFQQGSWILAKLVTLFIPDLGRMFEWFRTDGYVVDLDKVRSLHPSMKTFEEWLRTDSGFRP